MAIMLLIRLVMISGVISLLVNCNKASYFSHDRAQNNNAKPQGKKSGGQTNIIDRQSDYDGKNPDQTYQEDEPQVDITQIEKTIVATKGSDESLEPSKGSEVTEPSKTPAEPIKSGETTKLSLCGTPSNLRVLSGNSDECKFIVSATPTSFNAGSQDINNNSTTFELSPGSYGELNIGSNVTIRFKTGAYYFESIAIGSNTNMEFDTAGGDIKIYVKKKTAIGSNTNSTIINGNVENVCFEMQDEVALGSVINLKGSMLVFGEYIAGSLTNKSGNTWVTRGYTLGSDNKFSCR